MIHHLRHSEIDKERWDACIARASNRLVYALSWYLDCVSEQWDALVLDDYEAVMPLLVKKKWGLSYISHPLFVQQLGVFSQQAVSEPLLVEILRAIPIKYVHVGMKLNAYNHIEMVPKQWKKKRMTNYVLQLQSSYETISAQYSSYTKRNIAKAKQHELRLQSQLPLSEFIAFKMQQSPHLKPSAKQSMERILQTLITRNMGECFGVFNGTTLIAVTFIVMCFDRYIDLIAASNEMGKEQRARFFLIDQFIEKHSQTPMIFDFEGSTIPSIAGFFQGFGALKEYYHYVTYHPFRLFS